MPAKKKYSSQLAQGTQVQMSTEELVSIMDRVGKQLEGTFTTIIELCPPGPKGKVGLSITVRYTPERWSILVPFPIERHERVYTRDYKELTLAVHHVFWWLCQEVEGAYDCSARFVPVPEYDRLIEQYRSDKTML